MIISERAAANIGEVERMNAAKRALLKGDHNSHVYDRYKWFVDQNGLMKTVLSNANAKINVPPKNRVVPITNVVDHPSFYRAVPQARQWTAAVRDLGGGVRGAAWPDRRHIAISPGAARTSQTWLHELAHAAQKEHRLPANNRGTNPRAAGGFQRYRNNLGEVEARASGSSAPASQRAKALIARTQAHGVKRPAIKPPPAPAAKPKAAKPPEVKKPTSLPAKKKP